MLPKLHFEIERWKFNKDYGVYVSTFGNFKDRYKRNLPIKIKQDKGYCVIKTDQGYRLSHRLVMMTWQPIPDAENLTVDHLDHNKRNNRLSNLEWVTKQENQRRASSDCIRTSNKKIYNAHKYCINGINFNTIDEAFDILIKIYPSGYPKKAIEKRIERLEKEKNIITLKLGKKAKLTRREIK